MRRNPIRMTVMGDLDRRTTPVTIELLEGFRTAVVNGPRQAGKSTLVRQVQAGRGPVVNLDDPSLLDAAVADPIGFLEQLPERAAIDEFQRGGDRLLLALKMAVDASDARGQFLLAGSTRFLTTRTLSETLTGRIGIVELLPLSAGEVRSNTESFLDKLFDGPPDPGAFECESLTRADYAEAIACGGFPELVLGSQTQRFRSAWCRSYVDTVTAIANVEQAAPVRRPDLIASLLHQIAVRSAQEVVLSDFARELQVDEGTVRSYLDVLATLYLIRLVPAWTTSATNRAKRRPVAHVLDTAIAAHLVGMTSERLAAIDSPWMGPLLESYVVAELAKQIGWADQPTHLLQYRDRYQREVDVVLERGSDVVAIEVKATSTPRPGDARHLAFLRDRLGDRFRCGVVLHTGKQQLNVGDRLYALPVSALWGSSS